MKFLIFILMLIYLVSPIDVAPGIPVDDCQFGEKVAEVLASVTDAITAAYHKVEARVVSFDIPGKATLAWTTVSKAGADVKDSV